MYENFGEGVITDYQKGRLFTKTGHKFYNVSKFTLEGLLKEESDQIENNFRNYLDGFSDNVKQIIEYFNFEGQIQKMIKGDDNILLLVIQKICDVDLHPDKISNMDMGYAFEELIRRYSENAEAGDHYTPREVISLMTKLLFTPDSDELKKPYRIASIYDPTAGTGGMLAAGVEQLQKMNPSAKLNLYAQELNPESYAICLADTMIKGYDPDNIKEGNTLTDDKLKNEKFDYVIANPPFGVNWKREEKKVKEEKDLGDEGRFGAGLPRVSDGSLLFVQHMVSKLRPYEPNKPKTSGGRLAVILSGSPLFSGGAGSGESDVRKWLLESDLVEVIIGLPNDLFYNTGIGTYLWVISNKKVPKRKGKIQLIDATKKFEKMRKSLGSKRNQISKEQIEEIMEMYRTFKETKESKIYDNEYFGYLRVAIQNPLVATLKINEETNEEIKEKIKTKDTKYLSTIVSAIKNAKEFGINRVIEEFENKKIKKADIKKIIPIISERDEENGEIIYFDGEMIMDAEVSDNENIPLKISVDRDEYIEEYMRKEVYPHLPNAKWDKGTVKVGYEIGFSKEFYEYEPLRSSEKIKNEINQIENELLSLLGDVFGEEI
jgi:type I restriction enzyme M protein